MKRYIKFGLLWVTNVALLYLAVMFMPSAFRLGNNLFTPLMAAVFTGFAWNSVLWYVGPATKDLEIDMKKPMSMMLVYLVTNFATLWLLARFAVLTGFGASSYVYVFALAFVANFVQYGVWMATEKKK